ncbi:DUF309 domain-containing protein [Desulfurivibrio alkaliphilus]|uniref:Uncharacterized protein n=1 Tax=Desulfurivibrio alkaliphilus (strain DSM 19089 / UNIQEM U267 / AHT2) TaxID=589865 RepID=D6Z5X8_DESAT|nr:DUF309 domain-containing protein [Desulfurivibrio alkaliphilus]ADH84860.1 protein of unknown function DUF309 [Desulfurivibrio alkaliphilus AHT 2]
MTATQHFDPFNDRLARDLRNELSEALAVDLDLLRLERSPQVAAVFRQRPLQEVHRHYLEQRLAAYERVLVIIHQRELVEPFHRALVLWDEELFFEVHELLEPPWYRAPAGPDKIALQGMIRAAGVYVFLAANRRDSAASMAAKAISGLNLWQQSNLPPFPDLPRLQAALAGLEPAPLPWRRPCLTSSHLVPPCRGKSYSP